MVNNKKSIYIFIILGIIFISLFITILNIFFREPSFSTISEDVSTNAVITLQNNNRIIGHFTAKENHLGYISLPLIIKNIKTNAIYILQIREKNNSWFTESKYSASQFVGMKYFPFGF